MEYRFLGGTGFSVSAISFGCMSLTNSNRKDGMQLLREAVARGINFFDTADLYEKGDNERLVGEALKPMRSKIFLATKAGNQWRADGSGWDWNPRRDYILDCAEKSLKRLQTDYIDLYQLHGGTIEDNIDETIEAFELLKQQGKIRYYGISSIRPNVISEYVKRSSIESVMLQYSLLDRRPEEAVLGLLKEKNKGVLVRGALAQGLLIDKPAREYLDQPAASVQQLQQALREPAGRYPPGQLALQYVLQNPAVTTVVAGVRTAGQLQDLLEALEPVPAAVTERLAAVLPPQKYTQHR
ncbi:aldo/keto reductase [Niabella beijingensis]|uniref:aldo/keto reductase n=1 Tax=Niabella beijingensis TaxID=2872700 RepID=UPI001CBB1C95|nr:aldo/keto reductase [Niabella beijingensis]MBZ4189314.1 aldo/keto reductase [Niabella beijingensis]